MVEIANAPNKSKTTFIKYMRESGEYGYVIKYLGVGILGLVTDLVAFHAKKKLGVLSEMNLEHIAFNLAPYAGCVGSALIGSGIGALSAGWLKYNKYIRK
jgi:hypothetical protein